MNRVAYALSITLGVSGVMALVAWLLALAPAVKSGILLGISLASMNSVFSFLSLYWSFRRSNKTFYAVWSAGILARLLVLALTSAAVYGNPAFDFLSTLLTLVFTTMLLMFLELDFLPKRVS